MEGFLLLRTSLVQLLVELGSRCEGTLLEMHPQSLLARQVLGPQAQTRNSVRCHLCDRGSEQIKAKSDCSYLDPKLGSRLGRTSSGPAWNPGDFHPAWQCFDADMEKADREVALWLTCCDSESCADCLVWSQPCLEYISLAC